MSNTNEVLNASKSVRESLTRLEELSKQPSCSQEEIALMRGLVAVHARQFEQFAVTLTSEIAVREARAGQLAATAADKSQP